MNPTFWHDKRVFVTGHTGFKGAWLCMLLRSFGAQVAGYALPPPTRPSLYELARVDELIDSTVGDVRNLELLYSHVRKFAPEVVFHMQRSPLSALVRGPDRNVLDNFSARFTSWKPFGARFCMHGVNVRQTNVMKTPGRAWATERITFGGRDPYSTVKRALKWWQLLPRVFLSRFRFAEHGVAWRARGRAT